MHKNYYLLFLLSLVFISSACSPTLYVVPETYKYDDDISFTIEKLHDYKNGQISSYSVDKGFKAVEVWVNITNHSVTTKRIDLENILLLEPNSHRIYKPQLSMGEGIGGTEGRLQPPIKKGETKSRRLVFAYPEQEKPELLMVNGTTYHLQYTSAPPPVVNNVKSSDNE